ncbi:hypothetical protein ACFQ9X_48150 [Catenulispora yoronensis]
MGDLQLDLDGIDTFAVAMDTVTGQLDGSNPRLGDDHWLAGDKDLTAALDAFTARWRQAAPLLDSYAKHLSSMAHDCVARFRQTDHGLSSNAPQELHAHGGGRMLLD